MKKMLLGLLTFGIITTAVAQENRNNPFLKEYTTPFKTPPFNEIKSEHYLPAFKEGIKSQQAEIKAIINNKEKPTFENTIEDLDASGSVLSKVRNVFFAVLAAETNETLQSIAKTVSPLLAKQSDDINLNDKLFKRVKAVYDNKDNLGLKSEQMRLLTETYKIFVRGGANLNPKQKSELRKINSELAVLQLQFEENVLMEDNDFKMFITDKNDLKGLPESVVKGAADASKEAGKDGQWLFTLHKPSLIPFLQYAENRNLREKMFRGYIERGNNNNKYDNKKICVKIIDLRVKKAKLFGFNSYADFVLEDTMAKTPAKVYELLNKLYEPANKIAQQEVKDMQAIINKEGGKYNIEPWDWWFYSEKVKKEKYDLDEEMLRPYFKIDNVRDGAFYLANKLFGITFTEIKDIPVYHPDVKVFEVKEENGKHVGLLYVDYFPRAGKQGGAWMDNFRGQYKTKDGEIRPLVYNVGNFSKPVGDKPALISVDEVETLFHEFGHALHGLLTDCNYLSLSGANVTRDFVELPSQIMENWAFEPELMKIYARHYLTNEVIPDELIQKIKNAGHFNQGFATVEYVAASVLDMDWNTVAKTGTKDILAFEKASMNKIQLIKEMEPRYRSTYFKHSFGGGYAAGYYSYIWAAVLDSDAFEAFKEKNNIYDQETAKKFRDHILSKGNSDDPMNMYVKFRGKEPDVKPLLKKRGLL